MRAKMSDPFFAAPRTVPIYVLFATTELVEHLAAAWAAFVIQKSANVKGGVKTYQRGGAKLYH